MAGAGWAVVVGLAQFGLARAEDVSPFLPPNGSATSAGGQSDAGGLELRGIMSVGNVTRFCIYDPAKKTSKWVAANEKGYSFLIQSFDKDHDSVVVNQDGRRVTLALHEAKVTVTGGLPPPVPVNGAPGAPLQPTPGGTMPNVVLKPTPEDEQKRLQVIAEEVRRRRLAREQGQQPGAPGAPAAPSPR